MKQASVELTFWFVAGRILKSFGSSSFGQFNSSNPSLSLNFRSGFQMKRLISGFLYRKITSIIRSYIRPSKTNRTTWIVWYIRWRSGAKSGNSLIRAQTLTIVIGSNAVTPESAFSATPVILRLNYGPHTANKCHHCKRV